MLVVRVKRVYEPVGPKDGRRILVDRLWPRGIRKEDNRISAWQKEVSPSTELRKWFSHDTSRWKEFKMKYFEEISGSNSLNELVELVRKENVTLVYAARDEKMNNAVALKEIIEENF